MSKLPQTWKNSFITSDDFVISLLCVLHLFYVPFKVSDYSNLYIKYFTVCVNMK